VAYCANSDCDRETIRNRRYCERCAKRVQRGGLAALAAPIEEEGKTPMERVIDAGNAWLEAGGEEVKKSRPAVKQKVVDSGIDYLNAGDDDDECAALERAFFRAMDGLYLSRGWTPPGQARGAAVRTTAARRRAPHLVKVVRVQLNLFEDS
jgi:hypothetical protein